MTVEQGLTPTLPGKESNPLGSIVIMLHSHLPFYRMAGMWPFGEENLYECMAETYLPLLNLFNQLRAEGIPANITLGITPILAEQLADAHLKQGFVDYIETRLVAVRKDIVKYQSQPDLPHAAHLLYLAKYYEAWFCSLVKDFNERYHQDLLGAFRELQDAGCIEITTSAATHGFLPLLGTDESISAQLKAGVETYKRHFGRAPKGVWLPECAYRPAWQIKDPETGETYTRPGIDQFLFQNNLEYFFTEYSALEGSESSDTRRVIGIYDFKVQYLPSQMPQQQTGLNTDEAYWMRDYPVAVMGRSHRASFQVWSATYGYPGDGLYREFHQKDVDSGMHYWRLTSKDVGMGEKMLYDPALALEKAREHANHYVSLLSDLASEKSANKHGEHVLLEISFDTELFGHWWFEGVEWLGHVIRGLDKNAKARLKPASVYLREHTPKTAIKLPESTWGQGGHYWVWQNQNTDWMWPVIHEAEDKMLRLCAQYPNETRPLYERALNQALRELFLLQASDWPFLVTTFQAKDYAIERFNGHVERFNELYKMLESQSIEADALEAIEAIDNPFPSVDYRWYKKQPLSAASAV
ncbi:MAG: 1,4-alpha-glucan branching protein domain-containing protein [Vampirovibrionales bacterium]|nr:1,4-alpha-glucan branching protein domain-containing protein [Vampirovibrionales bacterium]